MKLFFFSLVLLTLTACDLDQNVSVHGIDLHTRTLSDATHVDFEAIVSIGNLVLPNGHTPIKNQNQLSIGEISTEKLEDGTNRIAVSVNYNELIKNDTGLGKTLPNGREFSSSIGNINPLYAIPILENSRVYIGTDPDETLYVGVVLGIPAFDHILARLSTPLNLFMTFPFSSEITAMGGIYTSSPAGQSGVGVFAKKSPSHSLSLLKKFTAEEVNKIDSITLFRLNHLIKKHAIVRIK